MQKANKMGAQYVLILGENERQSGTVVIKNMRTGESDTIKQTDAAAVLNCQTY